MDSAANVESQGGLLNTFTGLLSKGVDTALDLATLRAQGKASAAIGTVYPSGQNDPAAVESAKQTVVQVKENSNEYLKYALIGGGILAAVFIVSKLSK